MRHFFALIVSFLLSVPALAIDVPISLVAGSESLSRVYDVKAEIKLEDGRTISIDFSEADILRRVTTKYFQIPSIDLVKSCKFNWTYQKKIGDISPKDISLNNQGTDCQLVNDPLVGFVARPTFSVQTLYVSVSDTAFSRRDADRLLYGLRPIADTGEPYGLSVKTMPKAPVRQTMTFFVFGRGAIRFNVGTEWLKNGTVVSTDPDRVFLDHQIELE